MIWRMCYETYMHVQYTHAHMHLLIQHALPFTQWPQSCFFLVRLWVRGFFLLKRFPDETQAHPVCVCVPLCIFIHVLCAHRAEDNPNGSHKETENNCGVCNVVPPTLPTQTSSHTAAVKNLNNFCAFVHFYRNTGISRVEEACWVRTGADWQVTEQEK